MARFNTTGIDSLIKEMEALGELAGETADEMLQAGAEQVKQAWKASAVKHGHVDTGDMVKSIGFSRKPKTANDVKSIDIYPQGKDKKGVRNAEKAFVLHYGTSQMRGTQWVDEADEQAGEPATAAMEAVWDEAMRKRGLK